MYPFYAFPSSSGGRYRYQLSILPIPGLWISVSITIRNFVDTSIPIFSGQKRRSASFFARKNQTSLTKSLPLTYSSPKTTFNPNPSPKNRHLHFSSFRSRRGVTNNLVISTFLYGPNISIDIFFLSKNEPDICISFRDTPKKRIGVTNI